MTLELVNKMTDTQGDRPQTVKALAVANLVSGLFGGMGGKMIFNTFKCLICKRIDCMFKVFN